MTRTAVALLAFSASASTLLGQAREVDGVLARAAEYVERYERELGSVIAEEEYVQEEWPLVRETVPITGGGVDGGGPGRFHVPTVQPRRRVLRSNFLMLRLSGPGEQWAGFRDVYQVDNAEIADRAERFERLFAGASGDALGLWKRLNDESARYNLGTVVRNINVPTTALMVLRRANLERMAFSREGTERIGGSRYEVIAFDERARPTLIRGNAGSDVPLRGRLWIAADDGRVVRTEMRASGEEDGVHSRITTTYALDARLGLHVPVLMRERYETARGGHIECEARYSGFRRFETGARIVVP